MTTSSVKKETNIVNTFTQGKMYIHEDGDLVVAYAGKGDLKESTFHGFVVYVENTKPNWELFDESSWFPMSAFREFHGEVTLKSSVSRATNKHF